MDELSDLIPYAALLGAAILANYIANRTTPDSKSSSTTKLSQSSSGTPNYSSAESLKQALAERSDTAKRLAGVTDNPVYDLQDEAPHAEIYEPQVEALHAEIECPGFHAEIYVIGPILVDPSQMTPELLNQFLPPSMGDYRPDPLRNIIDITPANSTENGYSNNQIPEPPGIQRLLKKPTEED
ncbi:hypothetical protein ACFL0W_01775 [Nanoarchaeota archaeon]